MLALVVQEWYGTLKYIHTAPGCAVLQKIFLLALISQNIPYPVRKLNQIMG